MKSLRAVSIAPLMPLLMIGALLCVGNARARAADFVVTSTADSGAGSLRAAIDGAFAVASNDTITFDAAAFAAPRKTITLTGGQLNLSGNGALVITAPSAGVVVSGGGATQVFSVGGGAVATLVGLTISGGNAGGGNGGGIGNFNGTLLLDSCTLSGNTADLGGAVYSSVGSFDTMTTLRNCTLSGNTASGANGIGGALVNGNGTTNIESCTISGNTASAGRIGGVATVGSNGGDDTTLVSNSIIAGNTNGDVQRIFGSLNNFTSGGYNLIGSGNGAGNFNQTGDVTGNADPGLSALAENGGRTPTRSLLGTSLARDTGQTALTVDQRGTPRPQPVGGADDKGAFEFAPDPSGAAALVVTTSADTSAADGLISLREAITNANADGVNSAITFDAAVFAAPRKTITLGAQLGINANGTLSITAPAAGVVVSGGGAVRVFQINNGGNATLAGLTISDGVAPGNFGGGIFNDLGTLLLDSCTFSGNSAQFGGGVFSSTNLSGLATTIRNCTLSGNTATFKGGAILNNVGQINIESCTISGNSAPAGKGGGVFSFGNANSRTNVRNSISTGNTGGDVVFESGTNSFVSTGFNLIGVGDGTPAFNQPGDVINNADPGLSALAENGGRTPTRALLPSSPAVNTGDTTLTVDQRGVARPQGNADDKGAFEVSDPSGAAALIVTTTADVAAADGVISLREAIATANATASNDAITFDAAVFAAPRKTITLGAQLEINPNGTLSITAPAAGVVVSGGGAVRVFGVNPSAFVTLSGMTISGGVAGSQGGGGIISAGTVLLNSCTLSGNSAGFGGALFSSTNLSGAATTLRNCTLSGNTATSDGGAIYNNVGQTNIENCTISGNSAPAGNGSGVASRGDATTRTSVGNSIIAGNTSGAAVGGDVVLAVGTTNSFVSTGFNLIGTGNAAGAFNVSGDVTGNTDPGLSPLADNGGMTPTRALLTTSPAFNTGDTTVAVDQRGTLRPQGRGDDKGAFEVLVPEPTGAAALIVTTTADVSAADGLISLREAIATANATASNDVITFDATVFAAPRKTITLASAELSITRNGTLSITAPPAGVVVSGNNARRVFQINGGNATLVGLTISGGNASGGFGGGIYNNFGMLLLDGCTLSGNSATNGGGLFSSTSQSGFTTTLRNCTLSGNTATGQGGAIFSSGDTFIESSTISGNTAPADRGGGVTSQGDNITRTSVSNSIIAGNTGSDVSLSSGGSANSFASQGFNLIGSGNATGNFNQTGDVTGQTDPGLSALAENGGRTQTRALLTTSPALDTGNTDLTVDQRGVARPQGSADDKGAFEMVPPDPTGASALIVTTTADVRANDGVISLREAIATANNTASNDAITFDATVFAAPRKTITLTSALPNLANNGTLLITAPSEGVVVSGNGAFRVFRVNPSANVTLAGLTISGGIAPGDLGGGIRNNGTLLLDSCTLSGNSATNGGAISSFTNLSGVTTTIRNCTLSDNTATGTDAAGGALYNDGGQTLIESSTLSGNTAPADRGGGVASFGNANARTSVRNSIIAGNTGGDVQFVFGDGTNSFVSTGFNLIGTGNATGAFNGTNDVTGNADPGLAPLDENGGRTQTRALLSSSPALNTGNTALTVDQRGVARPQGSAADKGAFELVLPSLSIGAASVTEGNTGTGTPESGTNFLRFPLTLSFAPSSAVTVTYSTSDGSATGGTAVGSPAGADYLSATNATVTIAAGQTTGTITVAVLGDTVNEPDETLTVTLSGASGANLGTSSAVGTIQNDDVDTPSARDVSAQLTVYKSGLSRNRTTGRYVMSLVIQNNGATLDGPLYLALDGLNPNITLYNADGTTSRALPAGSPYRKLTLPGVSGAKPEGVFAAGTAITLSIELVNPSNAALTFTPRMLQGPGAL